MRGASSTLGGSGRSAKSSCSEGFCTGTVTGVGTREGMGVTALEERGLFFDRGREGAWRKSSGMSFQLSMDCGAGVVVEGACDDEADLGGGGGRVRVGGADVVSDGCSCC